MLQRIDPGDRDRGGVTVSRGDTRGGQAAGVSRGARKRSAQSVGRLVRLYTRFPAPHRLSKKTRTCVITGEVASWLDVWIQSYV